MDKYIEKMSVKSIDKTEKKKKANRITETNRKYDDFEEKDAERQGNDNIIIKIEINLIINHIIQ